MNAESLQNVVGACGRAAVFFLRVARRPGRARGLRTPVHAGALFRFLEGVGQTVGELLGFLAARPPVDAEGGGCAPPCGGCWGARDATRRRGRARGARGTVPHGTEVKARAMGRRACSHIIGGRHSRPAQWGAVCDVLSHVCAHQVIASGRKFFRSPRPPGLLASAPAGSYGGASVLAGAFESGSTFAAAERDVYGKG